jgi:predicted cobalt transporter CbtA
VEKRLIGRGLLAGGVGGLLAFVFARTFAEPVIGKAIDYESARDAIVDKLNSSAGLPVDPAGPDIFSRHVQRNIGSGVGMVAFGLAMGAIVAVVHSLCLGRTGRVRPRPLALLVAAAGFFFVYLVPFAKYPANPPGIGHEDTIRARGSFYLTMLLCSVVLGVISVWLGRLLRPRLGTWNATLVAGLAFLVAIGIVMALLPEPGMLKDNLATYGKHDTETPLPLYDSHGNLAFPGFPADVLAQFRVYSLATQAILWATIGVVFAPLAEKVLSAAERRNETTNDPVRGVRGHGVA